MSAFSQAAVLERSESWRRRGGLASFMRTSSARRFRCESVVGAKGTVAFHATADGCDNL